MSVSENYLAEIGRQARSAAVCCVSRAFSRAGSSAAWPYQVVLLPSVGDAQLLDFPRAVEAAREVRGVGVLELEREAGRGVS